MKTRNATDKILKNKAFSSLLNMVKEFNRLGYIASSAKTLDSIDSTLAHLATLNPDDIVTAGTLEIVYATDDLIDADLESARKA